jgi:hypothetical protein
MITEGSPIVVHWPVSVVALAFVWLFPHAGNAPARMRALVRHQAAHLASVILALLFCSIAHSAADAQEAIGARKINVILGHDFQGQNVTVKVEDEEVFAGRVLSHPATQLAAKIKTLAPATQFTLQVKVRLQPDQSATGVLNERIDLERGVYLLVMLTSDRHLVLQQFIEEPDFY